MTKAYALMIRRANDFGAPVAGLFFVRARCARVPAGTMNARILRMPNEDELRILAVAAIDGDSEYCLLREWNKQWGAEHLDMKDLRTAAL
jgi:hypothetical protein